MHGRYESGHQAFFVVYWVYKTSFKDKLDMILV